MGSAVAWLAFYLFVRWVDAQQSFTVLNKRIIFGVTFCMLILFLFEISAHRHSLIALYLKNICILY